MNREVRNASKIEAAAMEVDGKTRAQIAALLNVSNGTITNWLGKKPHIKTQIADAAVVQSQQVETPLGEQLSGSNEEA